MMTSKLDLTLAGDREIVLARRFQAPRALVFRAFTEPALVGRWLLGPPGWTMPVCEIDLRVGGVFRYVWRHTDGREMGLGGAFREIVPNERLVHTELFDADWTGGETLVTTTFAESAGTTSARIAILYSSREARDTAARSGMETGMDASYVQLDKVLALPVTAPRILDVTEQHTLVVRKTVSFAEMRATQQEAAPLLDEAVRDAGLADAPRLTVWRMQDGKVDYAPGRLVPRAVAGNGAVSAFPLPAGRAAHLRLVGGFEHLPAAWPHLFDACRSHGWPVTGLNWEVYRADGGTDLYALLG
ncbi:SRPBCC domain-containing protein [Methylobacterium sp. 77]|uniref:SRPBCC domain-containing protein n=1 Tax=Methylobacterium sp. 77 TaxID=1101192 RepID=UPI000380D9A4|nr:SRPBCC domain-containing protein [Methylobacterium sp. 77]